MSGSAIRRRVVTGAATVGVLALALVPSGAAQAAPATTTAAAATCKATGYSPSKVVLGSTTVKKTFSAKTSGCAAGSWWGILVSPYSSLDSMGKSFSLSDVSPTASFNPKTFSNVDAGKHGTGVRVTTATGKVSTFAFTVARAATFGKTLNASPASVKKGKKITVKATLKRIRWTWKADKKMPYGAYRNQPVALQFKAKGSSTFKTVKTVKTTSGGTFSTTVTASTSGTWRVSYAGNSTTGSAVSATDTVTVK